MASYDDYTVPELRNICKANDVTGTKGLSKDEIIALLEEAGVEVPGTGESDESEEEFAEVGVGRQTAKPVQNGNATGGHTKLMCRILYAINFVQGLLCMFKQDIMIANFGFKPEVVTPGFKLQLGFGGAWCATTALIFMAVAQLDFKAQKKVLQYYSIGMLLLVCMAFRTPDEILKVPAAGNIMAKVMTSSFAVMALLPCYLCRGDASVKETPSKTDKTYTQLMCRILYVIHIFMGMVAMFKQGLISEFKPEVVTPGFSLQLGYCGAWISTAAFMLMAVAQLDFKAQKKVLQYYSFGMLLVTCMAFRTPDSVLKAEFAGNVMAKVTCSSFAVMALLPCYLCRAPAAAKGKKQK